MAKPLRILVMADTHNHLPPELDRLAKGADEIWHLGDVCRPELIEAIREVGPPLSLVRGNCDSEMRWPLQLDFERNGVRVRLIHIPPGGPPADVDILLHGHTHVPRHERIGSVLQLNPGCVTRPNRGAPASVGYLSLGKNGEIEWTLKTLR